MQAWGCLTKASKPLVSDPMSSHWAACLSLQQEELGSRFRWIPGTKVHQ